jgi:LacI family transcriptional regulator
LTTEGNSTKNRFIQNVLDKTMNVTIRDVAKRAGLSITTVSRALDGYDDVADATRARVQALSQRMGYAPTSAARQMRRQRADAIGFVISPLRRDDESRPFADPFISEFVAGLGDETTRQDMDLLVSVAEPGDTEMKVYRRLIFGRRVDGFVINRLRKNDPRIQLLQKARIPFVASGRVDSATKFPYIEIDTRAGFRQMTQHLAAQGCKRIAFIGARHDLRLHQDRLAGYRAGLRAAGLRFNPSLLTYCDLTRQGGYLAALRLLALSPRPDAILGINDMTALGAMRAAHDQGLKVGHDIAVAGFDDIDDAQHAQPALSTLHQPIYNIARRLVQTLTSILRGETPRPLHVLLQPKLMVRASSMFVDRSNV